MTDEASVHIQVLSVSRSTIHDGLQRLERLEVSIKKKMVVDRDVRRLEMILLLLLPHYETFI